MKLCTGCGRTFVTAQAIGLHWAREKKIGGKCANVPRPEKKRTARVRKGLDKRDARIETLRAALKEMAETLQLSDPENRRALLINAPEDDYIGQICEQMGYGAVMDAASRLWRRKDPVGAHTNGACVGTVRRALEIARAALEAK